MIDNPLKIQHNESRKEGNIMANKTPESKLQANARFLEKMEQILFRVHADGSDGITKESIAQAAEQAGESMNTFIIEAIRQRMAKL